MSTGDGDGIDDVTALPALSEPDDAFVRGLLAGLPPVPVPGDLAARLDAALRAEAESAVGTLGPDAAPAAAAGIPGVAATVLPLDAARVARELRRTRILQVAAAALVLVAGGFGVVKLTGGGSSPGSSATGLSAGAAAAAPSAGSTYVVTRSGHAYNDNTLVSDVRALAGHQALTDDSRQQRAAAVPSPLTTFSTDLTSGSLASGTATTSPPAKSDSGQDFGTLMSTAELGPCLAAVEDGLTTPVIPIAMDEGTYRGQPALVVVLPDTVAPKTLYDVFVVGAQCGQNQDVHLLTYQTVTIH